MNVKLYFELDAIVCKLKPESLFIKRNISCYKSWSCESETCQVFHSMGYSEGI